MDVVAHGETGWLAEDLGTAVTQALGLRREHCVALARRYDWAHCTADFARYLAPFDAARSDGAARATDLPSGRGA